MRTSSDPDPPLYKVYIHSLVYIITYSTVDVRSTVQTDRVSLDDLNEHAYEPEIGENNYPISSAYNSKVCLFSIYIYRRTTYFFTFYF